MGFKSNFRKSLFILFYSVVIFSLVFALLPIGFIYAQGEDEPVNEVLAFFDTLWCYNVPEDTFPGGEVTGGKEWHAWLSNWYDATGDPVTGLILTLDTTLEFDHFNEKNMTILNPPPYEWSYGSLGDGSSTFDAYVGFLDTTPQPYPVTFTPGYGASRSADKTVFSQSDEPQNRIQTLTIVVTPQEDRQDYWNEIVVFAFEDELLNQVITSVTGEGDVCISEGGHELRINLTDWSVDTPQTFTVTIQVTPKVSMIEFMPYVFIAEHFRSPISVPSIGSSLSHSVDNEAPELGTWIWSAEGIYNWYWCEDIQQLVTWHPYSREIVKKLIADIENLNLLGGIEKSLTSKLGAAINSLNNGQENAAINKLNAFINQVETQRGKNITDEQADELIAEAQRIIDNI